jgi:hypothetical protein
MSVREVERFTEDLEMDRALMEGFMDAGTNLESIVSFAASKAYDFDGNELEAFTKQTQGALTEEEQEGTSAGGGHDRHHYRHLDPAAGVSGVSV